MTTARKLWLGFGTLTALLVLSSVAILVRVRSLEGQVGEMTTARNVSAAARELEVNLLGYALAVRAYLQTGEPKARQDADREAEAAEQHLREYQRLATTDPQREMAARFAARWQEFKKLGQLLLDAENRQPKQDDLRLFVLRTGLRKLLDEEMQVEAVESYDARKNAAQRDLQTIVAFALILLLVGVVIAVLTSGVIGRAVVKGERVIAEQGERLRTTLASIGDGVIATDTAGRITNLNPVAESLTGWKNDDASGQPLDAVFRIVNEQTRKPAANPVTRAIKEGAIVGLANHTVLIAKDGTERPIDDSAAPIRCKEGEVVGCVLIFRDVTEKWRADEKLRHSEERFRSLTQAITSIVWTVDAEGRFVTPQPPWAEFTGQTWDEYRDFGWANALHPDDRGKVRKLWEAARAARALYKSDGRLWHAASRSYRHFEARGVPILNSDGSVREWVGKCLDVEVRTRAEAAVKVSEVRYRRLFETAKDGILILDADTGKITDANPFLCDSLGYSHDEFLGKELWEIGLFKDKEASKAAVRDLQAKHYIRYEDLPLETKTGRRIDVEFVSNVYQEDHEPVIQCNIRDITERKRLEDMEREGGRRLRFVMDSMPQKIFTAKPNGDVDYFNPIWTEFSGLSFEQIRDWGWTRFIHPDDVAENVRVWRHSIDTGEKFLFEHRFRRADGEYRWHLSRALPMRDETGRVVMWIGSNTDIHEQRQTANQLRQYAAELSEADRRKNEFLAMLAHELRNPLAPISNAVQVMRRTGSDGEAVASVTEMMERQVGQLVCLVDDLLDVSRISRGKIELRKGRIELASVVHHAVEAARSLVQCMEHDLTVTLPPKPIYLDADPTRLAQVVGNLLNNACKFTDKGGRLVLAVEREGEQAVIRVGDSGIGIAADQLPRIFEMFMQVDTSLERSTGGLGIGLTLVKNLVEMHGGTVEVHSAGIGHGSEFVVRLPLGDPRSAIGDRPEGDEPKADGRKPVAARRILVVDDNRDSARTLAMLLEMIGNETQTAYDGLEAVEAAESFQPDVVLLDIGLPKLNGYEACRRIRAQPRGTDILLVALTGWGQEEDRQRSKEAGFDAHLVKPAKSSALMKLLAELGAG